MSASTVVRVWNSWADVLAHECVYGQWRLESTGWLRRVAVAVYERRRAACYAAAKYEWNKLITGWEKQGRLEPDEIATLLSCKPRGVLVNSTSKTPKFRCNHRLCPCCYYGRLVYFLRTNEDLFKSSKVSVLVWQQNVTERVLMCSDSSEWWKFSVANKIRARIRGALGESPVVCFNTLMANAKDDETRTFHHRMVFIGSAFPPNVHEKIIGGDPEIKTKQLGVYTSIPVARALCPTHYCRDWLKLPFDTACQIAHWNARFRTIRAGKKSGKSSCNRQN